MRMSNVAQKLLESGQSGSVTRFAIRNAAGSYLEYPYKFTALHPFRTKMWATREGAERWQRDYRYPEAVVGTVVPVKISWEES